MSDSDRPQSPPIGTARPRPVPGPPSSVAGPRLVKSTDVKLGPSTAVIAGTDLSEFVTGYRLHVQAEEPTTCVLYMAPVGAKPTFAGPALVNVQGPLRQALLDLGWTPPEKNPQTT